MEDFIMMIVIGIICTFLISILGFLITRLFWNWYFKINHRLQEQEKTNQLLLEIRCLLEQSNIANGIISNEIYNLNDSMRYSEVTATNLKKEVIEKFDDLPEL